MYYGAYDVPIKGSDKAYQDESEEVYQYLILAISPVDEEAQELMEFLNIKA